MCGPEGPRSLNEFCRLRQMFDDFSLLCGSIGASLVTHDKLKHIEQISQFRNRAILPGECWLGVHGNQRVRTPPGCLTVAETLTDFVAKFVRYALACRVDRMRSLP